MRKLKFLFAAVLAAGCVLIGGNALPAEAANGANYYIGGMTAGFSLSAGGVEIVGFKDVICEQGMRCPAREAELQAGDVIVAIDGIRINTVEDLNAALARGKDAPLEVAYRRAGEVMRQTIAPVLDKSGARYKFGILIRDTLSGIGTITYIERDGLRFGALGHAVCSDDKSPLTIASPSVYLCNIVDVNKGERGKAGELKGLFLNDTCLGEANYVCDTGLYGTFAQEYDVSQLMAVEAAPLSEATIGKAIIYSTVDGVTPRPYEIAIAKVDAGNRENKNFVIKVTDEALIAETGGIVQGMSGSPIVQNGKLIGAVTHVFLNDPTRGYGIGIENMLGK